MNQGLYGDRGVGYNCQKEKKSARREEAKESARREEQKESAKRDPWLKKSDFKDRPSLNLHL